jgi:chitinase
VVPQLVNGDFENGTNGWTGTCASRGNGDPAAHGGSNLLDVTASNGWFGGNVSAQCTQSITLTAGQYTLTTYLYGTNATVALSGATTASQTVSGSSWQKVTVPFTVATSGSVTVSVQTQSGGGIAPASNSVYADDFSITSP